MSVRDSNEQYFMSIEMSHFMRSCMKLTQTIDLNIAKKIRNERVYGTITFRDICHFEPRFFRQAGSLVSGTNNL